MSRLKELIRNRVPLFSRAKILSLCLLATVLVSSCSSSKGYNYKKHYRNQKFKSKMNYIFDLDHCRSNGGTAYGR